MTGNHFTGTIPQGLFQLTKLTKLALNNFTVASGPFENLFALTRLADLDWNHMPQMTGSISKGISALSALSSLSLYDLPTLSGPNPAEIGSLSRLKKLILRNVGLSGKLPENIGSLAELTELDVSGNPELIGAIPANITRLSRLRELHLSDNKGLNGSLPVGFENMQGLTVLSLPLGVNASKRERIGGLCAGGANGFFYKCCCTAVCDGNGNNQIKPINCRK